LYCAFVTFSPAFLCTKAATALARLSYCSSVCLSVCHTGGSVKNSASYKTTKSSSSAAWKTSFRNHKAFSWIV